MNDKELIERFEYLVSTSVQGAHKLSVGRGGSHMSVRCFSCLDSENLNHSHLYIRKSIPFVHYCQRCGFAGAVDRHFLTELGIHDTEFKKAVANALKKATGKSSYSSSTGSEEFSMIRGITQIPSKHTLIIPKKGYKLPLYDKEEFDDSFMRPKVRYLESRIKDFNLMRDYILYKIVFSIEDFCDYNNIPILDISDKMLDDVEDYGVGFMSANTNYLIFRFFGPLKDERYYDYNVSGQQTPKYLSVLNKVDLMAPVIHLYIGEGIFDIINVHKVICKNGLKDDHIFISPSGKTFSQVISEIVRLGFINLEIHFMSDKDVDIRFYKKIRKINKTVKALAPKMFVHYNQNRKDFGEFPVYLNSYRKV